MGDVGRFGCRACRGKALSRLPVVCLRGSYVVFLIVHCLLFNYEGSSIALYMSVILGSSV